MKILGLDPSLTGFGLALLEQDDTGVLRMTQSALLKTGAKDDNLSRYLSLREAVRAHIELWTPDYVAQEYSVFGSSFSEGAYALYIMTQEAIAVSGLDVVTYGPTQLKAFVKEYLSLKAKADKPVMRTAAQRLTNSAKKPNHNIADAAIIGYMGWWFWQVSTGKKQLEDIPSDYLRTTISGLLGKEDRIMTFSDPTWSQGRQELFERLAPKK